MSTTQNTALKYSCATRGHLEYYTRLHTTTRSLHSLSCPSADGPANFFLIAFGLFFIAFPIALRWSIGDSNLENELKSQRLLVWAGALQQEDDEGARGRSVQ